MEGYDPSTDPSQKLGPRARALARALLVIIVLLGLGLLVWKSIQ